MESLYDNNVDEIVANNNSDKSSVKVIHDSSNNNNRDSSNVINEQQEEDDVYKITRQSQQLYDKLKLSTSYTMTTHNSSSLATTSHNSPGATMSTTATTDEVIATDGSCAAVMDHDLHTAGSKESYDWVLQQLSSPRNKEKKKVEEECHEVISKEEGKKKKKEIFVVGNVDVAAVVKKSNVGLLCLLKLLPVENSNSKIQVVTRIIRMSNI